MTQGHRIRGCLTAAVLVFAATAAISDESAVLTAKGMITAGIINEKCTGHRPIPDETGRELRALTAAGLDPQDIKRGFGEGVLYAETTYPGRTRPPRAACREAARMHANALKLIENY